MNEALNAAKECVSGRTMNIKEKMLASADMQRKAIEILSSIKMDVTGGEITEGDNSVETNMDDVASRSLGRMDQILGLLCEIRDALGVTV